MRDKNAYQRNIAEYTHRRQKMRRQFGRDWWQNKTYQRRSLAISRKIYTWKKAIRRIEKEEQLLAPVARAACEFMDIDTIKNTVDRRSRGDYAKARCLFCKYVLENLPVKGAGVSRYIGATCLGYARQTRLRFTQTFPTHPKNAALYHRFKRFVKEGEQPVVTIRSSRAA